nr:hypothetical protein [uncultured Rhodopila sp.]
MTVRDNAVATPANVIGEAAACWLILEDLIIELIRQGALDRDRMVTIIDDRLLQMTRPDAQVRPDPAALRRLQELHARCRSMIG